MYFTSQRIFTMTAIGILFAVAISCSAQAAIVSPTSLELYYTYDSGTVSSTVVTDQYTTDGNADNIGRSTLTTFTAGAKFGQAINVSSVSGGTASTPWGLDATASVINSTFLPGTGDYTLSFWYRQGPGVANRIWGAGARTGDANNDDGLQLYLVNATTLEVAYHDPALASTTRNSFTANPSLTMDGTAWNLINVVRQGTSLELWTNGNLVGSATLAPGYNIAVNTGTFFREPNFGPDAAVAGAAYDDTAIWRRALSSTEIAAIYNGGTGATIGSLIAVPEPSTMALAMMGLLGVCGMGYARRRTV